MITSTSEMDPLLRGRMHEAETRHRSVSKSSQSGGEPNESGRRAGYAR